MGLAVFGIVISVVLVGSFIGHWQRMRRIPRLLPPNIPSDPPFVSILIPARNEERGSLVVSGERWHNVILALR